MRIVSALMLVMLVLNCMAAAAFCGAWLIGGFAADLDANANMTALDRAGVINEAKLREYQPELAANIRGKLGVWVASKGIKTSRNTAKFGMCASTVNITLMLFAGLHIRSQHRKQRLEQMDVEDEHP